MYEAHVKGFTKQHPAVPKNLRGTYAGFVSPAAIEHLTSLAITAVELLPVHYHIDEVRLVDAGLVNYWGYNTLSFFAPDPRYCSSGPENTVRYFLFPIGIYVNRSSDLGDKGHDLLAEADCWCRDILRNGEIQHNLKSSFHRMNLHGGGNLLLVILQLSVYRLG